MRSSNEALNCVFQRLPLIILIEQTLTFLLFTGTTVSFIWCNSEVGSIASGHPALGPSMKRFVDICLRWLIKIPGVDIQGGILCIRSSAHLLAGNVEIIAKRRSVVGGWASRDTKCTKAYLVLLTAQQEVGNVRLQDASTTVDQGVFSFQEWAPKQGHFEGSNARGRRYQTSGLSEERLITVAFISSRSLLKSIWYRKCTHPISKEVITYYTITWTKSLTCIEKWHEIQLNKNLLINKWVTRKEKCSHGVGGLCKEDGEVNELDAVNCQVTVCSFSSKFTVIVIHNQNKLFSFNPKTMKMKPMHWPKL